MEITNILSSIVNLVADANRKSGRPGIVVLTATLVFASEGTSVTFSLGVEHAAATDDAPTGAPAAASPQLTYPVSIFYRNPAVATNGAAFCDGDASRRGQQCCLFSTSDDADAFVVPARVANDIAALLADMSPAPEGPLWLCLVRPYGYLGLLPWEQGLSGVVGRPVLRLPESPYRAAERTDVLENIILVDPPPGASGTAIRSHLETMTDAILGGSGRSDTHIHIFAGAAWHEALATIGARDDRILLHPVPRELAAPQPELVTPWTAWILDVMEQRGIDAVHLLGRAACGAQEATFLLSATPAAEQTVRPDIELSADDLALLLNRAGAWSAVFVPATPHDRYALASAADDLAHIWHGAVLFASLPAEQEEALQVATRFLYKVDATKPPRLAHGFLYCHPDFLQSKQPALLAALPPLLGKQADMLAARAPATERAVNVAKRILRVTPGRSTAPPGYVAATQRFMEKEVFDGVRRNSGDVLQSRLSTRVAQDPASAELDQVRQKLLDEVHAVVAKFQAEYEGVKHDRDG